MAAPDPQRAPGPLGWSPRRRTAPWQFHASALIWLGWGIFELVLGFGSIREEGAPLSDEIQSQLPGDVAGVGGSAANLIPFVVGAVMIALTATLVAGRGWARYALEVLGTLAVVELAVRGKPEALIAMVLLVVASVPTMSLAMRRYLYGNDPVSTSER